MKTFLFNSPKGYVAEHAVADLTTVVVNRKSQTIFAEFDVYYDLAALNSGCENIGTLKFQLAGAEFKAVKESPQGAGLWKAIEKAAFGLGAGLFPADAKDVENS